jgi:hypothetical protein
MPTENGVWKTLLVAVVTQACLYYSSCTIFACLGSARAVHPHCQALGAASFGSHLLGSPISSSAGAYSPLPPPS